MADDNQGYYSTGEGYPDGGGYTRQEFVPKPKPWWQRILQFKNRTDPDNDEPRCRGVDD